MRKQQEMMQLYSQYGVSPMGGCLPSLIQMPIWIALFNFVPNAIQLRGESFLWADDLSAYDELLHWDTDLWLIGDHISVFCVLFSLTSIINSWLAMRQQQNQLTGDQAQQMKMMQYIFPIMILWMAKSFPAGLALYWAVSQLIQIAFNAHMQTIRNKIKREQQERRIREKFEKKNRK